MRNLRAICPNCGGKIHTQPKGLGHFTWANSWLLVQTGTECQHCGVALSGKVAAGNKAILAEDTEKTWWERETGSELTSSPKPLPKPTLGAEEKHALVVERDFEDDADALFAAVHRALLKLGYRMKSDPAARQITFKTPFTMASGRLQLEAGVIGGENGATLGIRRPLVPLFKWREKNEITRKVLGAVEEALAYQAA